MEQMSKEVYERAEKFIPWNIFHLIYNNEAFPYWIGESDCFWYLKCTRNGNKFMFVDANKGTIEPAFNHEKLAKSLSEAMDKSIEPNDLPFRNIEYIDEGKALKFEANYTKYTCDLESYVCKKQKRDKFISKTALVSPDENYIAFKKGNNINIRSLVDRKKVALTNDGIPYNDYGTSPDWNMTGVSDRMMGIKKPIVAIWSPDSKKLIVHKLDQSKVKDLHLIQSMPTDGTFRPKLYGYKFPMPGDENAGTAELIILDIEKKAKLIADHGPVAVRLFTPIEEKFIWWSKDSKLVYFIDITRGYKKMRLCEIDVNTGHTRVMIEEESLTFIGPVVIPEATDNYRNHNVKVVNEGKEVIWFSQRDGWAHLYLYDGEKGELKNQITSGEWVVRNVIHVDEENRMIYFTAGGREEGGDPYFRHLYRINFNGLDLKLLTPEDADHIIKFSPTGNFFVDIYSKINTPPIVVLRTSDGKLISKIDEADIEDVLKMGWQLPEPFKAKARDEKTDIYGSIFRPTNFDPSKKYPIIDVSYPGPQTIRTPKTFPSHFDPSGMLLYWELQAIAEVGFIVVTIDGLGTPLRSRKFHELSYGNLGDAGGLEDHICALKQLAKHYPNFDLDKVGIYGHSGGGFAAARAILQFPDFYKVAISSAGNHDQRAYMADWGEHYQGMLEGDNYLNQVNAELAKNLKGKLLLIYGDMDDNSHPAMTIQLIDALVKANKDYDLMILPNRNHALVIEPYFLRKRWDYFVLNLLNLIPPKEYEVKGIDPELLSRLVYYTVIK